MRFTLVPDLESHSVHILAEGFRWTRHRTLELWRKILAGPEEVVAEFEAQSVVDVVE